MPTFDIDTTSIPQVQSVDRFNNAVGYTIAKIEDIGTYSEDIVSNQAFYVYIESAGTLVGETAEGDIVTFTFTVAKEEFFNVAFKKILTGTTLTGIKIGW